MINDIYKEETERVIKITSNAVKKDVSKIAPTPFNINQEVVTKILKIRIDDDSKIIETNAVKEKIKLDSFVILFDSYNNMLPYWCKQYGNVSYLLGYIRTKLEFGSNCIELREDEYCRYSGCSRDCFYKALKVLLRPASPNLTSGDTMALLASTNKKSKYIVNHNFMFKGNYDNFVNYLAIKYNNKCPLDENGRVILK